MRISPGGVVIEARGMRQGTIASTPDRGFRIEADGHVIEGNTYDRLTVDGASIPIAPYSRMEIRFDRDGVTACADGVVVWPAHDPGAE